MKEKTETIQGTVERITFANEENGYSVLRVKVPGRKDLVSVTGNFVSVTPGEVLRMEGTWGFHSRFGEQFEVKHYETAAPSTVEGIRKYLGSGLIKGIGPVMAKRIVACFGEHTLDVIDREVDRLREVGGIGAYRLEQISKAWEDQREIRDVMVFLRSHGVSAAYATRIFKHYGKEALGVVKENPYRLALDVSGIGFITADKIARNLGIPEDSPLRAEAGVHFVIFTAAEDGHVCVPRGWLVEKSAEMLGGTPEAVIAGALERLLSEKRLVRERLEGEVAGAFGDEEAVYLSGYHVAEKLSARRLIHLEDFRALRRKPDVEAARAWLRDKMPFTLAALQEEAVRRSMTDKVLVITGGPGTGKTTLVRAILAVYRQMGARVCLAAPTGRAAKRLSEATGHAASTVHRLLEFSPQQ